MNCMCMCTYCQDFFPRLSTCLAGYRISYDSYYFLEFLHKVSMTFPLSSFKQTYIIFIIDCQEGDSFGEKEAHGYMWPHILDLKPD